MTVTISNEQEKLEKFKIEMQTIRQLFMKATVAFFAKLVHIRLQDIMLLADLKIHCCLGKDKLAQLKLKLKDLY